MIHINKLHITALLTGFSLMAFELAAARVLAPTIGSSTYVWTSVIGIIIAALSIGYYIGGRVADRRKQTYDIAALLLLASFAVVACLTVYPTLLGEVTAWRVDVRLQALVAASLLFAPASFLLGTISPYLVKLNVQSLKQAGSAVADLSALNSIGGIIGTFVTGFILFGYIGARETIALVAIILLLNSWWFIPRKWLMQRIAASAVIVLLVAMGIRADSWSIDTASAHYEIREHVYGMSTIRGLSTGPRGIQSAVYTDGRNELVFWYTQQMAALTVAELPKNILILGGGTFTLPRYLAERLPDSHIDVVEIDPNLVSVAKKHFFYDNPSNVSVIAADARWHVNQTDQQYDVVLVDVYGDAEIPFSLMTQEYGAEIRRITRSGGVVVVNIIGGATGPCREVFDAATSGYYEQFTHAQFQPNLSDVPSYTNIIAVFSDKPQQYGQPLTNTSIAYTDNYAPAERFFHACQQTVRV